MESGMASATKTIRQKIEYRPGISEWFETTQALFNNLVGFYFEVIQAHSGVLDTKDNQVVLSILERLTHATKRNPHPVMPDTQIGAYVPAMFRRATINIAIGEARSFFSNLKRWQKQKTKMEAKGRRFTHRPPVPPRKRNHPSLFYSGMRKEWTSKHILLKLWDGKTWRWVRFRLSARSVPEGWKVDSPVVVHKEQGWALHTSITKKFVSPGKIKTQIGRNPNMYVCAVDLNINDALAVCTILNADGTVVATRFIRGGRKLHDRRKRLLGMIARNRHRTGIIAKDEQDNAHLWAKIRNIDENEAHRISRRIIQFAQKYGAAVVVFEHLGNFRPKRGKYSRRGNEKRTYWLRGRIFRYTKYKGWQERIITSRVNPRDTSRNCVSCGKPVARYNEGESQDKYRPGAPLFYCLNADCKRRGNADHNASRNIGKKLFIRYKNILEKPHIRPSDGVLKGTGISFAQDAGDTVDDCISSSPSNGTEKEMGKAPPVLSEGVQANTHDGIPRSLRSHRGSGYAADTSEDRLRGSAQRSPRL